MNPSPLRQFARLHLPWCFLSKPTRETNSVPASCNTSSSATLISLILQQGWVWGRRLSPPTGYLGRKLSPWSGKSYRSIECCGLTFLSLVLELKNWQFPSEAILSAVCRSSLSDVYFPFVITTLTCSPLFNLAESQRRHWVNFFRPVRAIARFQLGFPRKSVSCPCPTG